MQHKQLIHDCANLFQKMLGTMEAKNADYAGAGDAFHNFTTVERMGIVSTEIGFLTRMSDKFTRLASIIGKNNEPKVTSETARDTLLDLANYCVLLCAYLDHKGKTHE